METVRFRITGFGPGLLMHNPASMQASQGSLIKKKSNPTPEEDAAQSAYRLEDGTLYAKADWFKESLRNSGKGLRIGKEFASAVLKSSVFPTGEVLPLQDPETGNVITEYVIDRRRAVIQNQGITRSRALIPSWSCEVEFDLATLSNLNPQLLLEFMQRAGELIGVGDYRPERGGPFGRFTAELVE